ncbi:hypothetical protein NRP93_000748 [Clostridium botulinum]|nr:hypothetical protein [Clostridium botulinum]
MKKNENKYFLYGIIFSIVCICGDWLLGYLNPKKATEFSVVCLGAAQISDWRIYLSMFCAVIGFAGYLYSLYGVKKQLDITNIRKGKIFYILTLISSEGWILIHVAHCVCMLLYKNLRATGNEVLAIKLTDKIFALFYPFMLIYMIFMAVPFILLFVWQLMGKTIYKRCHVIFNPIIFYIIALLSEIIFSNSSLAHAFYLGGMNEGMLVFFLATFLLKNKSSV